MWTARAPTRRPSRARRAGGVAIVLAIGWLTGCASLPRTPSGSEVRVLLQDDQRGKIWSLPLEEYVVGVVLAEVSIGSVDIATAQRLAEVQGLVTRTYAIANLGRHTQEGFDLCTTTHCQVFRDPGAHAAELRELARQAVRRTAGQVITHGTWPIQALFHSNCGGYTSAANAVWGGTEHAYLTARPDSYCTVESPASWQWTIEADRFREMLNRYDSTRVGPRLASVRVVERDIAGRAIGVTLGDTRTVRGEVLRAIVMSHYGSDSIRSTRFTVRRDGDDFRFAGAGYGHGAGLCQTGALARARAGETAADILAHYYPGTKIEWYRQSAVAP